MDAHNVEAEDLLCDESFQRYLRGEAEADMLYWENWIKENSGKKAVVDTARRMHEILNMNQGNRLEQLSNLKDAIIRSSLFKEQMLTGAKVNSNRPGHVVPFYRKDFLKYAAGIIILITVGGLAYISVGKRSVKQPTVYEYYTSAHDRKTVMLPDSSIIMLNENSHLSVSQEFSTQYRQVAITGEAFFDIKHDARSPFLVKTAHYNIHVLGTTFNVRSYPGTDTTVTTLLTGKVEITEVPGGEAGSKVLLKPYEKFVMQGSSLPAEAGKAIPLFKGKVVKPYIYSTTHHLAETSWARHKMEIKDKTLGEIAEQLQAWYGIKMRFDDETIKNYRYTATFDDETVFTALKYLQQSYPFTYTVKDDCIVIARN